MPKAIAIPESIRSIALHHHLVLLREQSTKKSDVTKKQNVPLGFATLFDSGRDGGNAVSWLAYRRLRPE